jgi:hypothetical protein
MPCKSTRTLIHHFSFLPLSSEEKTPRPWTKASSPRRAALRRNARFKSESSLDLLLVFPYDLALYLLSSLPFSALIYFLKKSLGPKTCLSTSPLILPSKQRTLRLNRGPAINCAAAFGTCCMTSGTSPLVARPNASVAWIWRH